jgi:hypothetical protein
MGSARRAMVGLGATALLLAGLGVAAAQTGAEAAINSRTEPEVKRRQRTESQPVRSPAAVEVSPRAAENARATPATPATPASPGVSAATPAVPATPPSGLSHDAPDTAPSIGVVGHGREKSHAPSPAATPEPSTLLLMGTGLAGLWGLRRRK